MTWRAFFDRLLDRGPGWPNERGWVTIWLFVTAGAMLLMARENPELWNIKLFELLIQAIFITGIINAVLAFHFAANKAGEDSGDAISRALDVAHQATKSKTDVAEMDVDADQVNVRSKG